MADTELKFTISADASGVVTATSTAGTALGTMGTAAEAASNKGGSAADLFASSLGALTTAITGVGAAALAAAVDIDNAFDKMRVATGKTGTDLTALETSFKTVFAGVPSSADDVATAIAGLNTKLDLTGPALETVTEKIVNLSRITGTDVKTNVDLASAAFQKWGVDSETAGGKLDTLFKVTQLTGIEFPTLTSAMTTGSAALKTLGFDFDTAAVLIGTFEQNGVTAETATAALKIALTNLAEHGVTDANAAFGLLVEKIKTAPTDLAAVDAAADLFGKRGAVEMANAIRSGNFQLDAMKQKLDASPESINAAAAGTADFAEKWTLLKNNVELALDPLGAKLMTALGDLITAFTPLVGWLESAVKWFTDLPTPVQNVTIGVAAVTAGVVAADLAFAAIVGTIGLVIPGVTTLAAGFGIGAGLAGTMGLAVTAGAAVGVAIAAWEITTWITNVTGFKDALAGLWTSMGVGAAAAHGNDAALDASVKKAADALHGLGVEVDLSGQSLEEQHTTVAAAWADYQKLHPAVTSTGTAAGALSGKLGGTGGLNKGVLDLSDAAKKAHEESAKLHKEFNDALNPADVLEKKLVDLKKAHQSDSDLLKVYGPEVKKLADKYDEEGKTLPPLVTSLAALKKEQNLVSDAFAATITELSSLTPKVSFLPSQIDAAALSEVALNTALAALGVTHGPAASAAIAALEVALGTVETAFDDGKVKPGEMQTAYTTAFGTMITKTGELSTDYAAKLAGMVTETGSKTGNSTGMLKTWNTYIDAVKLKHGEIPTKVTEQLQTALDSTIEKTGDKSGVLSFWKTAVESIKTTHGTLPPALAGQLGTILADTDKFTGSTEGAEKVWKDSIGAIKTAYGTLPPEIALKLTDMVTKSTDKLHGPTDSQVKVWSDAVQAMKDEYGKLPPEVTAQLVAMVNSSDAKLNGLTDSQIEVWKKAVGSMKDEYGNLPASVKATDVKVNDQVKLDAAAMKDEWGTAVNGIVTKYQNGFTDILVGKIFDGKSLKDSFVDMFKSMGRDVVTAVTDELLKPVKAIFTDLVKFGLDKLGELLGFDWSGIFGGGGGGGGGGGIGTGGGAAGGASGSWGKSAWEKLKSLGGGIGKAIGAHPWIAGITAAALGIGALIAKLAQKDAWEAASLETLRDFDVGVGEDEIKGFAGSVGLTEETLWPIRKDILSSPRFLTEVAYPAAVSFGKETSFLNRLESVDTAWGSGNFREPFEKGLKSGDYSDLNAAYKKLFGPSKALEQNLPGWETALMAPESKGAGIGAGGSDGTNLSSMSFALGGPVPRTGLARVHEGEFVVPRAGALMYRQMAGPRADVGITVNINGPVYGIDDLDRKVADSIQRTKRAGGLGFLAE